jgi:hypothetical protein
MQADAVYVRVRLGNGAMLARDFEIHIDGDAALLSTVEREN